MARPAGGPGKMNITQAAFVTSSADPERVPVFHAPEYAFIGRSNVGKS